MKFKFKVLLAATLLASALPAAADMTKSNSASTSSLILTILDMSNGGKTATFDLGPTYATFAKDSNLSIDLTSGDYKTAWDSFKSTASTNLQYNVFAGDFFGTSSTDYGYITTAGGATMSNITNSSLSTALGTMDLYINANNGQPSHNGAGVTNGGSVMPSGSGAGYARTSGALGVSNGKVGNSGSDATGLVGADLSLWTFQGVAGGSGGTVVATKYATGLGFNPFFNLSSDGLLSYTAVAAVPEADSSLMILAGIGMMGFIARRRKAI